MKLVHSTTVDNSRRVETTPTAESPAKTEQLHEPGAYRSFVGTPFTKPLTTDGKVVPFVLREHCRFETSGAGGSLEPIDPERLFMDLDRVTAHLTTLGIDEQVGVSKDLGVGTVSADAEVLAGGQIEADGGNLSAKVGVRGSASVDADFDLKNVPVAGVVSDLTGNIQGEVEAGAYAEGQTKVEASFVPPRACAEASGSTFAGAKAKAKATVGSGGVTITGEAGAWAGAGAEGKAGVSIDGTKIKVQAEGGGAWGYGAGAGLAVEVDVLEAAKTGVKRMLRGGFNTVVNPRAFGLTGQFVSSAVHAIAA